MRFIAKLQYIFLKKSLTHIRARTIPTIVLSQSLAIPKFMQFNSQRFDSTADSQTDLNSFPWQFVVPVYFIAIYW